MIHKFFYVVVGILLSASTIAQTQKDNADTTTVTVKVITEKDKQNIIVDDKGKKWVQAQSKPRNVTTSWWGFDIGFSNYTDRTNYAGADAQAYAPGSNNSYFDLRTGKSINVNIWVFSQKVNLIQHVVNLKYALGVELNNYRYKSNIRYNANPPAIANPPMVQLDVTPNRNYIKNKLAADYVTLPVMINFDFTPSRCYDVSVKGGRVKYRHRGGFGYGFSAGMSVGYLYSARNKFITSDEGKRKIRDDFDLRPWKLSYIGEVNLGYVSLYGSYAMQSMYKRGLDITPFNIGLRLGL